MKIRILSNSGGKWECAYSMIIMHVGYKSHSCWDITAYDITLSTGLPFPPKTPYYTVQQYGQDSVIFRVQWQRPQYDSGTPVNYTVIVSSGILSPLTTNGTSALLALPYNVMHTVNIVATNCNGSSSAAMLIIRIGVLQFNICNVACLCLTCMPAF